MAVAPEILSTALELEQSDRAELAYVLLDSLGGDCPPSSDRELLAEADRRDAMMDADPSMEISHEELLESLGRKPGK